jgi:Domain of unknown function (DUF4926)
MTFRELDSVVLTEDVAASGLCTGDLGAVVHVYDAENFEVEFVRCDGTTQALLTLTAASLRPAGATDVLAVRTGDDSVAREF